MQKTIDVKPMMGAVLGASLMLACGHGGKLVPEKSAQVILGAETAAVAVVDGVRCSANGDAWQGTPKDLTSEVIPVKVRIKNNSGRPIALLYERFSLVGKKGRQYFPVPLVPIPADADSGRPLRPVYAAEKFFVAPKLRNVYRTLEPWPNPFDRNDVLYRRNYAKWGDDLPSRDMLERGMPEGVLGDGGTISGFLYFDGAAAREDRLLFKADVNEGNGDERVALIEIPFRVE